MVFKNIAFIVTTFVFITFIFPIGVSASYIKKPNITVENMKGSYNIGDEGEVKLYSKDSKKIQYKVNIWDAKSKKIIKDVTKGYTKALPSDEPYIFNLPTDDNGRFGVTICVKRPSSNKWDNVTVKYYNVNCRNGVS